MKLADAPPPALNIIRTNRFGSGGMKSPSVENRNGQLAK